MIDWLIEDLYLLSTCRVDKGLHIGSTTATDPGHGDVKLAFRNTFSYHSSFNLKNALHSAINHWDSKSFLASIISISLSLSFSHRIIINCASFSGERPWGVGFSIWSTDGDTVDVKLPEEIRGLVLHRSLACRSSRGKHCWRWCGQPEGGWSASLGGRPTATRPTVTASTPCNTKQQQYRWYVSLAHAHVELHTMPAL